MKQIILLMLCLSAASYGQRSIRGKVYDATTKESLIGVNVIVPSTTNGTVTDQNGNFRLQAGSGIDSLELSLIGYKKTRIYIKDTLLKIGLQASQTSINEVIVSVNRERMNRSEAPVAISSISQTTINDTKAAGLEVLLNKTPGVYMVDLGNEQHSMAIRQPLGTRSLYLYLEDGIPIRTTGDFNHNALIEINQAALNRIEVIKGPASSLYGSEAVGGAINFITQAPSYTPKAKIQAEGGSFGYKRTDFNVSNTIGKVGIYAGGYYANRNEADSIHNDFQKTAVNLRGDYNATDKTSIITSASFISYKTDQKGGLDSANFFTKNYTSLYRFTYRSVDAFRLRSTLQHSWNSRNKSTFTLYYRNSSIGQNPFYAIKTTRDPLKYRGEINKDAFKSLGSVIQHTTRLKVWNTKIISGLSADINPATYEAKFISIDRNKEGIYHSYTASDSVLTRYNVDILNTAAYANIEVNPVKPLRISGALRYDRLDYNFNNHLPSSAFTGAPDERNYFEHFTPKVGATYDLGKNNGVYVNYSVGFAPPNITELYKGVKVPVLQPASFTNYEAGGWYTFASERGYVELNVYQLDGRNEIVSVRLPDGSYANQNAGKTSHRGIEGSLRYSPVEDVTIRLSSCYAEHRYMEYIERGKDYSGNEMGQAPCFINNSEVMYKPRYLKGFRIGFEWQGIGDYFMDAMNTQKYAGYNIFNIRTGYRYKSIEGWVNVMNVTDEVYATTVDKSAFGSSYRPGQLRTINAGLAYYFDKK